MRVAIIHDWLNGMRGGERVLEVLSRLFSEVEVYTLFYEPEKISTEIRNLSITPSILQKLPFVRLYYRLLLPLYGIGIWDLGRKLERMHHHQPYDLVISVSHCVAKNIRPPESVFHLCYCLTPVRYLWDQFDVYFQNSLFRPLIALIAKPLRAWDVKSASSVDRFIGISKFVCERIKRYYGRDSSVIYPPVSNHWGTHKTQIPIKEGFLCVNALVPYKNVDVVILAFNELGLPLTVVGRGPEKKRLQRLAKKNICFLENISDQALAELYSSSRALVFAAEEDFGMTPVEMQSAGRPVIALGKGGALETVRGKSPSGNITGLFFYEPTAERIVAAVNKFIENEASFSAESCKNNATQFSIEQFNASFDSVIRDISGKNRKVHSHVYGK
jgi:glycosyltransferase involved in cell wall biosynthesis